MELAEGPFMIWAQNDEKLINHIGMQILYTKVLDSLIGSMQRDIVQANLTLRNC